MNEIIEKLDKQFRERYSVLDSVSITGVLEFLHNRDNQLIKAIAEAVKGQKKRGTGAHTEAVAIINSFGEEKK